MKELAEAEFNGYVVINHVSTNKLGNRVLLKETEPNLTRPNLSPYLFLQ